MGVTAISLIVVLRADMKAFCAFLKSPDHAKQERLKRSRTGCICKLCCAECDEYLCQHAVVSMPASNELGQQL
jgi:hypothetical protein